MPCLMHGDRNYTGGGSGSAAISTLTDVDIDNLTDGQILKWNATSQKWENSNESGGGGNVGYATFRQSFNCSVGSGDANKEIYFQLTKQGYINDGSGSQNYYDFSNCVVIPTYFAVTSIEYQNESLGDSELMKESFSLRDYNISNNWIGTTIYIHNLGFLNIDRISVKVGFAYVGTPTLVQ